MSKTWEEWDCENIDKTQSLNKMSANSREAFRSQLRKRIQERAPHDGTGAFLSVDEVLRIIKEVQPPE